MSPKWFRRVRVLFQDGFVAGPENKSGAAVGAQSIKGMGKKPRFGLEHPSNAL